MMDEEDIDKVVSAVVPKDVYEELTIEDTMNIFSGIRIHPL